MEYRRINDIIVHYKGSLVLELQQRAIEFSSMVDRHQNIRYLSFLSIKRRGLLCHLSLILEFYADAYGQVCSG